MKMICYAVECYHCFIIKPIKKFNITYIFLPIKTNVLGKVANNNIISNLDV